MKITSTLRAVKNLASAYIISDPNDLASLPEIAPMRAKIADRIKAGVHLLSLLEGDSPIIICRYLTDKEAYITKENIRQAGALVAKEANRQKHSRMALHYSGSIEKGLHLAAEGILLTNYQFFPYRTMDREKCLHTLSELVLAPGALEKAALTELEAICDAVYLCRDLVNKPLNYLGATDLALACKTAGAAAGFKVTVYDKKKITALKMGGLLSVNMGSPDPPTFTIMEYKPTKPVNKQPIVLVGKGVVYDTGGLSLKPTPDSMDHMKCDMAGAAAVLGAMVASSRMKLPVHLIGLIPATDNRPGGNAYTPGDVITMYSGKTVEVLNTDAEGRMILADALAFASQYKPELTIDLATLTGAAARAIGTAGSGLMSTASRQQTEALIQSGYNVYERLIELPLWKEYGEMIKSDIADIKNTGGPAAGVMTAGKFLEHFTDYPWIHLDIATAAWLFEAQGYRTKGSSGLGVRLLVDFLKQRCHA